MAVTIDDIRQARVLLAGNVVRTPLLHAPKLSEITGAEIYVKFENLQVTNSFKDRGAYVKMQSLTEAERDARRHCHVGRQPRPGGGLPRPPARHSGHHRDARDDALQPRSSGRGRMAAQVVLSGETLADSQVTAEEIIAEKGCVLIHPYDDDQIIAGQGTIGLEMLEDEPGARVHRRADRRRRGHVAARRSPPRASSPQIEMMGVEVKLYPSMYPRAQG